MNSKGICSSCNVEYMRAWRLKNPEKYKNGYQKRNKSEQSKNRNFDTFLKRKYGITAIEYKELLEKQNNKCAICSINQDDLNKKLSVDHCHKTNKVRGLLCTNCNVALGQINDDISLLLSAINYLEINK